MDKLSEIRQRTEAAKAQKEKGDSITAACIAWSIVTNDIPYLLSEVGRLTAQLAESQRRGRAAVEFIKYLDRNYSGYMAEDERFAEWRGPQEAGEGEE